MATCGAWETLEPPHQHLIQYPRRPSRHPSNCQERLVFGYQKWIWRNRRATTQQLASKQRQGGEFCWTLGIAGKVTHTKCQRHSGGGAVVKNRWRRKAKEFVGFAKSSNESNISRLLNSCCAINGLGHGVNGWYWHWNNSPSSEFFTIHK